MTRKEADVVKWKAALLLFLAVGLPWTMEAFENQIETSSFWQEIHTVNHVTSRGESGSNESTLYFNDGFGRLVEFHMTTDGHFMTVTIRQNMNIVWKEKEEISHPRFSVVRREELGQVYFLVTMGDKRYKGYTNAKDVWSMEELNTYDLDEEI